MATEKQITWLISKINGDHELRNSIPYYSEEKNGQTVNLTLFRLGQKLKNITKLDAHFLINNIQDNNLDSVKLYLAKLY